MGNKLFCDHDWVRIDEVRTYWNFSGFKVRVYRCICSKCFKAKNKKFW